MPWQYLTPAKLLTKANVLAGPILREVTADFVSVWFALQKKATVKLTVMTKTGIRLFDGSRDTIAVGARLHVVAVTARRLPDPTNWRTQLAPGLGHGVGLRAVPAATVGPAVTTWSGYRAQLATLNRGGADWVVVPAHEVGS